MSSHPSRLVPTVVRLWWHQKNLHEALKKSWKLDATPCRASLTLLKGLSRKVGSSQSQAQKSVSATPQPQRKANTPLENNTDFEKK
jgi:hypothetical protein